MAIEFSNYVLEIESENIDALLVKCNAFERLNDNDNAILILKSILQIEPENKFLKMKLNSLLMRENRTEELKFSVEKINSEDDGETPVWDFETESKIYYLIKQNRFNDALEICNSLIPKYPEITSCWNIKLRF